MNADLSEAFGSELVLLGAADDAALADAADALVRFLDQAPGVPLRDVAYTCARRFPESRTAVLSIVARSAGELRARLISAAGRIRGGTARVRDKKARVRLPRRCVVLPRHASRPLCEVPRVPTAL